MELGTHCQPRRWNTVVEPVVVVPKVMPWVVMLYPQEYLAAEVEAMVGG